MAQELQKPLTRAEANRLLIANALTKPFPNILLPAGLAIVAAIFGLNPLVYVIAAVAWLALGAITYFDQDEADRVISRARDRRRKQLRTAERVELGQLSEPVGRHLAAVLEQEQRIRQAIEKAELPFEEVSGEVDTFVRAAERAAGRAQLLYEYVADEDPARVAHRLDEVRASEDPSKAPLIEALTAQLEALGRAEAKLAGFYTEMERIAVELGNVRGQLLSVSATSEAAAQRELAAGVRDLREQVGAVAEGMSEVLEETRG